jgi:O-antigen/teichoic acid export membrane protein
VIVGLVLTSAIDMLLGWRLTEIHLTGHSPLHWQEFTGLAAPMFFTAISLRTFERIDLFALQTLGADAAQTGLYGAAQNLAMTPVWLAQSLLALTLSSVAELLITGDVASGRRLACQTLRGALLLLPLAALVAGSAPQVISFVYGTQYAAAAPVLRSLIFAAMGLVQISTVAALLSAFHRATWQAALVVPLVPLAIAVHAVVIPRLGPTGAALTTVSLAWSCTLVSWYVLYRLTRVAVPLGTLLRSAFLSLIGYFLVQRWPSPGPAWLPVQLISLAVLLGVTALMLGEFHRDEHSPLSPNRVEGSAFQES